MNKLTIEERAKILHLLCEGMSIRAITDPLPSSPFY
jgi:IS30 family transposase